MKKRRSVISLLLAALVLAGMLSFTALSASAAVTPPGNPFWDGFVARWEAPDNEYVQYYRLYLYQNGSEIRMEYPEDSDFDFESVIKAQGKGSYQFSVATAVGNDQDDTSEFVYSDNLNYDPSGGHILIQYQFKYPGCTTPGDKGHYECTHCGKWYWDAEAQYEITDHSEVLTDPIGHDWGEWVTAKEATKTEDGLAERVCNNDPSHVEQKVIPRLDGGSDATAAPAETQTPATSADASQATEAGTEAAAATINEKEANSLLNLFSGGLVTVLVIACIAILIIVAVIIIIVVVVKNKKKQQQYGQPYGGPVPPANGQTPPAGMKQDAPDKNDYNDPYNG